MSAITVWSTAATGTKAGERAGVFADVRPAFLVAGLIGWGAFALRLISTFTL